MDFLPPVDITCDDFHRLVSLTGGVFLPGEIARTTVRDAWDKTGFVSMNSPVRFRDNLTRDEGTVRLVHPRQALVKPDAVSVLTWVGAALIGVSEGHSIAWRADQGAMRSLTVLRVD